MDALTEHLDRHGELVNLKFERGLSPEETKELEEISQWLHQDNSVHDNTNLLQAVAVSKNGHKQDDLSFLQSAGMIAVGTAQKSLLEKKIGYVYSRGENLIRRNPDGIEEVISSLSME